MLQKSFPAYLNFLFALLLCLFTIQSNANPPTTASDLDFFGHAFNGDSFTWCLDTSCSSGWNGEIQLMKANVTDAISQLDDTQEFGVLAFNSSVLHYSSQLLPATSVNKASAIAWVNGLTPNGSSCGLNGVLSGLSLAQTGQVANPQLFLLTDGAFNCPAADATAITAANTAMIPIHAVMVGSGGEAFMEELAMLNNGIYIPETPIARFIRGDCNSDGSFNLPDIVVQLDYLFNNGCPPCVQALDIDASGIINISDTIYGLAALFTSGPSPNAPFPNCGEEALSTSLGCLDFGVCQ